MPLTVHVWSDVACPWCYVGKRRLEAALKRFGEPVSVQWHAFELDPRSGPRGSASYVERLASKYGLPVARAQDMIDNMARTGLKDGIAFDFARAVPARTFDAHRLSHLALAHGVQNDLEERLFRAHFCEGAALDEAAVLTRLGVDAGLDADHVAGVLASDQYAAEVEADKAEARALGVTGVPFFVFGRYAVAGAQSADQLLQVLDRANLEQDVAAPPDEGAFCGPDGC